MFSNVERDDTKRMARKVCGSPTASVRRRPLGLSKFGWQVRILDGGWPRASAPPSGTHPHMSSDRSHARDVCTVGPLTALMCSDKMSDRVDDEEARLAKLIACERRKERRRSAGAVAPPDGDRDRAWADYVATGAVIERADTSQLGQSAAPRSARAERCPRVR